MTDRHEEVASRIPCTFNKCISYPLCLNKNRIKCDLLTKYIMDLIEYYDVELFRLHGLFFVPKVTRRFIYKILNPVLKKIEIVHNFPYPLMLFKDIIDSKGKE